MNTSEIIRQLADSITAEHIILPAGIILFGIWVYKTSFGKTALAYSIPRRNNIPAFVPFIPLFIWFGTAGLAMSVKKQFFSDLPSWESAFLDNLILCFDGLVTMTAIIFLAKSGFARRLKGFGFNLKTIHKDFFAAFVNLLSVWPLIMAMIMLTTFFGKILYGRDYHLQQHQELEMITAHPQLMLRFLIVVVAVIIAPVVEEMLFRGLFQTMIRSFLLEPWLSIAISSGMFAVVHPNAGHWPALFTLSMCMGYAYEKSGSLFRPIFIHSFFNATAIIAALNQ